MITEDYVSYEVAKLLKEKGFDENCSHFYRVDGEHECCYKAKLPRLTNNDIRSHDDWVNRVFACTCPTLQMAMKWLRKVHNILIVIDKGEDFYAWQLENNTTGEYLGDIVGECKSYEQACEAAIKYCLKNLV